MGHSILTTIVIMGHTGITLGGHGEVGLEVLTGSKKHDAKHERLCVLEDQYLSQTKEVVRAGILNSDNTQKIAHPCLDWVFLTAFSLPKPIQMQALWPEIRVAYPLLEPYPRGHHPFRRPVAPPH